MFIFKPFKKKIIFKNIMKNQVVFFMSLFFLIQSCAIFRGVDKDQMIGKFDITVLETPYGDVPLILDVTKAENKYSSQIIGEGELEGVFEVSSTEVSENKIMVEADAMGNFLVFELNVNEDQISGSMMDFEVKGNRIKE